MAMEDDIKSVHLDEGQEHYDYPFENEILHHLPPFQGLFSGDEHCHYCCKQDYGLKHGIISPVVQNNGGNHVEYTSLFQ